MLIARIVAFLDEFLLHFLVDFGFDSAAVLFFDLLPDLLGKGPLRVGDGFPIQGDLLEPGAFFE